MMKILSFCFILLAHFANSSEAQVLGNSTSGYTMKVEVKLKQLWSIITDDQGKAVDAATAAHCSVYEGETLQKIQRVIPGDGRFATVLAVDRSSSMESYLETLGKVGLDFAQKTLSVGNEVGTVSYSSVNRLLSSKFVKFADDQKTLTAEQEKIIATPIMYGENFHTSFDSLSASLIQITKEMLLPEKSTLVKSIILFTDGGDYQSLEQYPDMLALLKQNHIRVHVVHLKPTSVYEGHMVSKEDLKKLGEETGGSYQHINDVNDIEKAYQKIGGIFQSALVFLYSPTEITHASKIVCPAGLTPQTLNWGLEN